jgi:hypothetical protein
MEGNILTKRQRNILKNTILKELTNKNRGVFDKKDGRSPHFEVNLVMIMKCVFDGLHKHIDYNKKEEVKNENV